MLKVDETSSADGARTGIIFMRFDGSFEKRIYRATAPPSGSVKLSACCEVTILTGTLAQARLVLHEELGCDENNCDYCKSA